MKTGLTQAAERLTLGDDDLAVLARLRAVAVLFRAAAPVLPALSGAAIGLELGPNGRARPIESADWEFCRFVAQALDWRDAVSLSPDKLFELVCDRVAHGAFPTGCPSGLVSLLRRIPTRLVGTAESGALSAAGWRIRGGWALIEPVLPDLVSAHEALEALLAAEAGGGLGSGPLGLLARQAAAALVGNAP